MLISIHDRTLERVGFLSNDDSESPDFKDDNFHRYLAQGTSTFILQLIKSRMEWFKITFNC
ncbi:hypothetical protein N42HA_01427 [Lactococcus lactis]|nr:hypothetical protein [Lactococcus lactis]MDU0408415.1 hypothetical protein [Lactococcus lactis]